ncbi:MAG: hypothetical protein JEZ02_18830 [Desulfatibacillum sp.]|nr:hypothetical protein [Desulfatibacillum sp.]
MYSFSAGLVSMVGKRLKDVITKAPHEIFYQDIKDMYIAGVTTHATYVETGWEGIGNTYAPNATHLLTTGDLASRQSRKAWVNVVGNVGVTIALKSCIPKGASLSKTTSRSVTIAKDYTAGNPAAIYRGMGSLNGIQTQVLEQLRNFGSKTIVKKRLFGNRDMAALTAATGDEFAMFTTGGRRLIIRGNPGSVPITPEMAGGLASKGWRWTSHTHPGAGTGVLRSSIGDRAVLKAMQGNTSAVFNSVFQRQLFSEFGDVFTNWLPW